jgi:indole-3-glycerol phosphate synthase
MTPTTPATSVPDVLAEIVETSRRRVAEQTAPHTRFSDALRRGSDANVVSVITEHKRASPSAGTIREDLSLTEVIGAYEQAGAAALSILTEPSRFAGSLDDIVTARAHTALPILRKDFIVDPYQVYEASAAGADAILLIVAAFPQQVDQLRSLQAMAAQLGLEVLMEVHNAAELEVAQTLRAPIIGINNRNLSTLEVDLQTTYSLREQMSSDTIVVAESGFSTPEQVRDLAAAGIDAVLIGEALMRAPDIAAAAAMITQATV